MANPPFGFSSGDDSSKDEPGREEHGKKNPDSGSGAQDPLAAFGIGGEFGMGDLGQIFTQLGQMFSNAGSGMAGGQQSGPVNYDLARRSLFPSASSSTGHGR